METFESRQFSAVTRLPATFSVKRCLVEQDLHGLADLGALRPGSILDDSEHHAFALIARIAGELGAPELFGEVEPQFVRCLGPRALPSRAGLALLLSHRRVEAIAVHRNAPGPESVLGQIVRKSVGVVELESRFSRKRPAIGKLRSRLVEQFEAR